jgi:hypothetical protein
MNEETGVTPILILNKKTLGRYSTSEYTYNFLFSRSSLKDVNIFPQLHNYIASRGRIVVNDKVSGSDLE